MVQHVLKLGGSLLDLRSVQDRVRNLAAQFQLRECLLITGGGAAADAVRERQQAEHFDDEAAHWEAIAGMALNARRLFADHPGFRIVRNRSEIAAACEEPDCIAVVDATEFIRSEEESLEPAGKTLSPQKRLRPSWDVTSDAIATWLGLRLGATSVWLLKSCDPPSHSLQELSLSGHVDRTICELPIPTHYLHWFNLRPPTSPPATREGSAPAGGGPKVLT